jgi:hypothetical protein
MPVDAWQREVVACANAVYSVRNVDDGWGEDLDAGVGPCLTAADTATGELRTSCDNV